MQSSGFLSRLRQRLVWGVMAIVTLLLVCLSPDSAAATSDLTVYRAPSCSCCGGWIDHLKTQGFNPENVPTSEMEAIKQEYGVPESLASCHTAIIDGYVIEGHVPVADIQQLLSQRPEVAGIAVPGMPIGTPGMESGDRRDDFTVFSFDQKGNSAVFNQYEF